MRSIRKKLRMLLAVCLLIPCISMVAYAAEGVLTFSDPTTKVGETVTVRVKVDAKGSPIGDSDITVTYDATKLEFVGGENAEGGNGTVNLSTTGDGSASELRYEMNFRALAEGETKIEVSDYKAYLYNDETLNLVLGWSLVTIEPGDPNAVPPSEGGENLPTGNGPAVTVNGVNYTISSDFADVLIPEGFTRTAFTFEGQECQALQQGTSGLYMVYLVSDAGEGKMFLYNPENGEFSACEKVRLSDTSDVILMQFAPKEELPKAYKETEFELNGVVFPAWQDPTQPEFFVVNAVNTAGAVGYYQYDASDATYQRFVVQKESAAEEKTATGFFGKIEEKLKANLSKLLIGVWAAVLVLIIIIIILAVKLKHRNEELDDWYDDFGDAYEKKLKEEKSAKKSVKSAPPAKTSRKAAKPAPKKEETNYGYAALGASDDDLFDDDFDDKLFDDDSYDRDYDDTDDYYDDDDYEDFDDDLDDEESSQDTSEYSIDFIDLD